LENRRAELENKELKLTRKEFDLLAMLMRHAGEVVPREALLAAVWGYQPGVRTRTLDVHVRRLRVLLGRAAGLSIETVFGIGYRYQPYRGRLFDTPPIRPTEQFGISATAR
jgi:DNA-binding response OmpR family regulator